MISFNLKIKSISRKKLVFENLKSNIQNLNPDPTKMDPIP